MRWLVLFLVACGNSGSGTDGGSGAAYSLANADAVCDGVNGLTANALLAKVPMPTKATFTYFAQGDAGAKMPSPFTLDVSYMGGTITCTPHHDPPPGSDAPSTPAQIKIVVVAGFKTDDGAFAETGLAGTLEGSASFLSLAASEPATSVKGSYKPSMTTVTVTGTFGVNAPTGNVSEGGGNATSPIGSWK